jgi:hypothetical protein
MEYEGRKKGENDDAILKKRQNKTELVDAENPGNAKKAQKEFIR